MADMTLLLAAMALGCVTTATAYANARNASEEVLRRRARRHPERAPTGPRPKRTFEGWLLLSEVSAIATLVAVAELVARVLGL